MEIRKEVKMLKRIWQIGFVALVITLVTPWARAAELTIGARSEPSIDPHYLWVTTNVAYNKHIFGLLVDGDDNGRIIPSLATSWRAIDDTTWEFKLRKGVKFHDGSEFTAEDVVFSFDRIRNLPNNPASYASNIRSVKDVEIVDPYTFIIKANDVNPVLPVMLQAAVIVSKKAATGATTADFFSGKAAIGTGPFKFVSFARGDRLVLERNENYWGEKPAWDRVTFRIMSNDAARVAALMGGDVDMIDFVPPSEAAHLGKNKNLGVFKRPSGRLIFLTCNNSDKTPFVTGKDGKPLEKNPLKDVRVRRALSKGIDRNAICARVMEGLAAPASQIIAEHSPSYNPDIKVEKYDPEGAKRLLAEAGYPHGFGLTIHGPSDRYVNDAKICQAVAQMLARIGLDMKVVTLPQSVYFGRMLAPSHEFSLSLAGWGFVVEADSIMMAVIHSYEKGKGAGSWNCGYSNPSLDRAMEQAVSIMDNAKRHKAEQKVAEQVIVHEQAMIPLHTQFTIAATRKGLVYAPRVDEQTLAMNAKPAP
jgi:peptide/nickel transport system substrate-binding protein